MPFWEKAPTVVKILHSKDDETFLPLNAHIWIPTLNFLAKMAFSTSFCPIENDPSGNTV